MIDVGELINKGKTKKVYKNLSDRDTVFLEFTDAITAGDAGKKDIIFEKGIMHWTCNKNIFELLNKKRIPTHYISSPSERYCKVLKLDEKIDLECVARRIATGSYLKRYPKLKKGKVFDPVGIEFFYKNDLLNDPMVDTYHLKVLMEKNPIYKKSADLTKNVFEVLEKEFSKQKHQLIDIKIEVGAVDLDQETQRLINKGNLKPEVRQSIADNLVVIDEITADNFRLWPYESDTIDLKVKNALNQLNEEGMKDKEVYRQGAKLSIVKEGFEIITEMTKEFK